MNINIKLKTVALLIAGVAIASSCTKAFEEYNTNPYAPTEQQMLGDNANVGSLIEAMQDVLVQGGQNDSQMLDQMIGGEYGGCISNINPWGNAGNFYTYNPRKGWIATPFNTLMPQIYTNYKKIKEYTGAKGPMFAWAKLLRVFGTLRLSDIYGPMPYSQVTGDKFTVAYDDMPNLYKNMFKDLDEAISTLETFNAGAAYADFDHVYNGDFKKWVKFANTLKLRMALRISNADPDFAKTKAVEAVNHSIGVMTEPGDAAWSDKNDGMNPLYRAGFTWQTHGDFSISANIVSYLLGFNDPRLDKYVTKSTHNTHKNQFLGVRNGIYAMSYTFSNYQKYSKPNIKETDKLLIMSAAEAYFLQAEAALKTWSMKGQSSEDLYKKGVEVAMKERGADFNTSYFSATNVPGGYTDPLESSNNIAAASDVSTLYNIGEDEKNLERIIVQKWIANFPNGWEAWADFRRTGYPKFFPIVENHSTEGVTLTRRMRRLPFPEGEYNTNAENVQAAVTMLGGKDNSATDLWWAKKD